MSGFGVDPETMGEMPMPPEMMEAEQGYEMDPGAQGDPQMMDPAAGAPPADPYAGGDAAESESRDRVQLCVLLAIENAAKAVEAGVAASNPQFAQAFGQAAASLGQAYASLALAEVQQERNELDAVTGIGGLVNQMNAQTSPEDFRV